MTNLCHYRQNSLDISLRNCTIKKEMNYRMDEVTFTKVRSELPAMDEGANKDGKRYCLVRHKKKRLVVLSMEDYEKLVVAAGSVGTAPKLETVVVDAD